MGDSFGALLESATRRAEASLRAADRCRCSGCGRFVSLDFDPLMDWFIGECCGAEYKVTMEQIRERLEPRAAR